MAAHRIPYAATLSIAHRDDFLRKLRTALGTPGFRFLLMLSPCPTGWKSEPDQSVALIRAAVGCGLFPVYEVRNGIDYEINIRPDGTPVEDYVEHQRRYNGVVRDPARLRAQIQAQWRFLDRMAAHRPA